MSQTIVDEVLGEFVLDDLWVSQIHCDPLDSSLIIQIKTEGETPDESQLAAARELYTSLDRLTPQFMSRLYAYYSSIPESEKKRLRFPDIAFPPIESEGEVWKVFTEPGIFVSETSDSEGVVIEWLVNWAANDTYAFAVLNGEIVKEEYVSRD